MGGEALAGLIVPVVTPFDASGRVDVDALGPLVGGILDAGAAGLAALATTGEAHALDDEERDLVIEVCDEACRAREAPLLVGAGTYDTRTTIGRHRALSDHKGVTHSLCVVPYYVRPGEAAVVRHFQAVAAESPVPLVIYNIPYRAGMGLGAEALLALARTPNIAGVKQAVGSVDADTLRLLAEAPEGFAVLCGDDAFIAPMVLMGGAGAIAAAGHLATAGFVRMIAEARVGSVEPARRLARALRPLVEALFAEPSPSVLKAVLHAEGLIGTPAVRMPLSAASRPALEVALAALRQLSPELGRS